MIFFVLNTFNCVSRLLVIQLTLLLLLIYADHSIASFLEYHSIGFQYSFCYHSIGLHFSNHSIGFQFLSHSIGSATMPVLTRLMTKQLASSDLYQHSSLVDRYTNPTSSSSLLVCLECGSDPPSSQFFQTFWVSKFRNLKRSQHFLKQSSSSCHLLSNHQILDFVPISTMELDCEDQVDGQPSLGMSTQHDIFKMLTAISSQMMQNYQDIQNRLENMELRFSQEITHISQEHDDFKRDTTLVLQTLSQGPSSISGPASNGNPEVPTSASVSGIPSHSHVSPSTPSPTTVILHLAL
jgi:hypothetical protein